jgi:N-carbamoyl-L-amino-acid hydrolase
VLADLRELERRTAGPEGARRLCWGHGWREARALLGELVAEIGLELELDQAGNAWAYLEGESEPALVIGSHLDSVPGGGWLDGSLGVCAALGALRAWATERRRPTRTLALVDWSDEEGARFGRSLFGSSAVAGRFDPAEMADSRDQDERTAREVLAENGIELDRVPAAGARRDRVGAYLELHIEQGPVLDRRGKPTAAVVGCVGVERWRLSFTGQASHAGSTPMGERRDAGLAAAAAALRIESIGARAGGTATTGRLSLRPGVATAVAGRADLLVDLRHAETASLEGMVHDVRGEARAAAEQRGCELVAELVWRTAPTLFDPRLVAIARRVAGGEELFSGALHDAAEMARIVPAAMLFCPSIGGISHAKEEDTAEPDIAVAVESFGRLVTAAIAAMPPGPG